MSKPLSPRRDEFRRGGFTLLEVVIALAIFVFGALAIVRIFPPALGVIQNTGDRLVAVNLNRSTLANYAKNSGSVPYATYGVGTDTDDADGDGNTTEAYPLAAATVGNVQRNNALPKGVLPADFQNSALSRFRNISGERQIVRSFRSGTTDTFYVLTSFPYDGTPQIFREGILDDVQSTTVGTDSGLLTWTPIAGDSYFASYNYLEGGVLQGTNDEAIEVTTVPTATQHTQLLQGRRLPGTATDKVVDGPIRVRYRTPLAAPSGISNGNLGLIELSGVTIGQEVSLDYTVKDWRMLVNDSTPSVTPEATPAPISGDPAARTGREVVLPVRLLSDDPIYSLLGFLNPADTATPRTQVVLQPAQWTLANTSTDPSSLWNVDRKTGRVLFDLNTHVATPTTRTLTQSRVVYQTLDSWTHQVSVAPAQYTPFYASLSGTSSTVGNNVFNNPAQPWRYYAWSATTKPENIYFPPSEAGKTILLSYSYNDGANKELRDELVTISENLEINTVNIPAFATQLAVDGKIAYVTPKPSNGGTAYPLTAIRSVSGVGIQTRTAWLDGSRFTQASTVALRGVSN